MNQSAQPDAASVFELAASYYMISRVIQACAHLGVFSQLSSSALSAPDLARNCQASVHGIQALLNTLQALGIVEASKGKWQLCPQLQEQLPDETLLAGLVGGYEDWLTLDDAVRTGEATIQPSFLRDPDSAQEFLVNMHFSSLSVAQELAAQIESAPEKILDLGGGLGTYSLAICQRFKQARATILELPKVAAIGKRFIARSGQSHRIRFVAGDYLSDPFPEDNDLILMCNILHQEKPSPMRLLFRKARASLADGGRLIIHETLLGDSGKRVLAVALAALNSLLYYGGRNYREYQILKWLKSSGLGVCEVRKTEQPGVRIIVARRSLPSQ